MILDELAAFARKRVAADQAKTPLADIKAQAEAMPKGDFRFEKALAGKDCAFICEVKKASPSKGVIDPVFDFEAIARSYEDAGADCVSCLTEPNWFLGSDEIFKKVRKIVTRPMIRKDFTVDEYQIYQAKVLGADAVLLICTLLDTETIRDYIGICDKLGMSALVETHDAQEMQSAVRGRRAAHRREQPQPQGLHRRPRQRGAAARTARRTVRFLWRRAAFPRRRTLRRCAERARTRFSLAST